ncbi:hypothetical protein RHDC4_02068 [Rhodocyclaceae bacterium]|nr:hypothetical protein RHDC4_02068 [Rhodocyclaceae bacterium]
MTIRFALACSLAAWLVGCATHQEQGTVLRTALIESINARKHELAKASKENAPAEWARLASNLGADISRLGKIDSNAPMLHEATNLFRSAIDAYSTSPSPYASANTVGNLCSTLVDLTKIDGTPDRYLEAEKECRRAVAVPDEYQMLRSLRYRELGNILWSIGQLKKNHDYVREAISAYQSSLALQAQPRDMFEWARTQNDLGSAFGYLGSREKNREMLLQAVESFSRALGGWPQSRFPKSWATTQHNLGTAFLYLDDLENHDMHLVRAEFAYREALKERGRDVPERRVETLRSLAKALLRLSKRDKEKSEAYDYEARNVLHEALDIALDVKRKQDAQPLVTKDLSRQTAPGP